MLKRNEGAILRNTILHTAITWPLLQTLNGLALTQPPESRLNLLVSSEHVLQWISFYYQ
jgi:hypothetical protein